MNKSFYNNSYKDYTKLLNISIEENKFLFSYILLQEFIKEIISIEMAFIMFDPEPNSKKHNNFKSSIDLEKNLNSDVENENEIPLTTNDVINIINKTLDNNTNDINYEEEIELNEIKNDIENLHLNDIFLKELEKEENIQNEDSDDVMRNIEDINDVILKSIQQNFSKQYSLDLDQFKESFSMESESQCNKTSTSINYPMYISTDSSSANINRSNELNITQEIKKMNALFNTSTISDVVNPFEYESLILDNSITNTNDTSDVSCFMKLKKNSSGSFLYEDDLADSHYMFDDSHRKSSTFKSDILNVPSVTAENGIVEEIDEVSINKLQNKMEINKTETSHSLSMNQNGKELQIPLVSETNTEYYKYLKELPDSPVLPSTLLKTNNDSGSSSTGSLIDPMENEDDLAYLEYLEKVSNNEKYKKLKIDNSSRNDQRINNEKVNNPCNNNIIISEKEKDNVNEFESKLDQENEEIISCSSPTAASINSLSVNDIDNKDIKDRNEEEEEEGEGGGKEVEVTKNKKNLKTRLNNNVEKFFSHQKQKINSFFNHKNNIIEPEIDQVNIPTHQNDTKDSINYDSSYTEFYSETFDESSFLKKNLNTGFGYF